MHDDQHNHPIDKQPGWLTLSNEESQGTTCHEVSREEAECPQCQATMRLWAGFYRCPNCGYKESCCF
jgi:hypothetical protein